MTEQLLSIRGNNKKHEMREQIHHVVEPIQTLAEEKQTVEVSMY